MEKFKEYIRLHVLSTALTAASALMLIKTVLPGVFDFVIDIAVLGIIAIVGNLAKK